MTELDRRGRCVLSVVIPTLNAAAGLAATVASLAGAADEIVVADGGSDDATVALAHSLGARVIAAPRGRGAQLAAGVAAATGEWLLLLHADTALAPGWADAARAAMADHPACAAYFRFALATDDPRARRLERMVAWRCRMFALPYGDQGLLMSRALLRAVGGIRPLQLMEDVELVRRIGRRRLRALDVAAVTSAQRWQRDGWYRRSARNMVCLTLYLCGVSPSVIARRYAGRRSAACPD